MAPTKRGDAGRTSGDGWECSRAEAVGRSAAPGGGPCPDTKCEPLRASIEWRGKAEHKITLESAALSDMEPPPEDHVASEVFSSVPATSHEPRNTPESLSFANTPSAPQAIDPEVVLRQPRVRAHPGAVLDPQALPSRPSVRGRPSLSERRPCAGPSGLAIDERRASRRDWIGRWWRRLRRLNYAAWRR
jgi:hypothetical protein